MKTIKELCPKCKRIDNEKDYWTTILTGFIIIAAGVLLAVLGKTVGELGYGIILVLVGSLLITIISIKYRSQQIIEKIEDKK